MTNDIKLAKGWFDTYRSRGFNPLPSDPAKKKPLIAYKQLWDTPAPYDVFDKHPSTNLQVMSGRRWQLLVIDLDGIEAQEWWKTQPKCPPTWVVQSGGGGMHLWFRLKENLKRPIPKAFLWKGEGKHSAVERLCDNSLVMAPPSIHPTTGRRYVWLDKDNSPGGMSFPAMCPQWVLDLKPIEKPRDPNRPFVPLRMDSVPDKIGLARSWGVRLASSGPDRNGFWACHAIDREDRTPSASINENSGYYVDHGHGVSLSFIDLALALRAYSDIKDALTDLRVRSGQERVSA